MTIETTTITKYKTTDGKLFDFLADAQRHERRIEWEIIYETDSNENFITRQLDEVAAFVERNFEKIKRLMDDHKGETDKG